MTQITDARVITATTLSLPATVRATAFGPQAMPATEIELHAASRDAGDAASNAAQLLGVLYGFGVTSPEQLARALRTAGHQEVTATADDPAPHTPTPSGTPVHAGRLG